MWPRTQRVAKLSGDNLLVSNSTAWITRAHQLNSCKPVPGSKKSTKFSVIICEGQWQEWPMTNTDISSRGRGINIIIFHSIPQLSVQVVIGKHPHLPASTHLHTSKTTADLEWLTETSLRRKGVRLSCRRNSEFCRHPPSPPAKQEHVRTAVT